MEIAIIDNDEVRAKTLAEMLEHIGGGKLSLSGTAFFKSGIDFVSDYRPIYDIVFIETDLPLMNGLTVAGRLRRVDSNVCIILVSDTEKYAIDGYSVKASGYVVRPLESARLSEIFSAVLRSAMNPTDKKGRVFIRVKNGFRRVFADELCYVEVRGHALIYKLMHEEILGIGALSEIEDALVSFGFYRLNKSYIVNPDHISEFIGDCVRCGDTNITVSRKRLKDFKTYYSSLYLYDDKA